MNHEYLKSLQERAQKLLQMSSQEEDLSSIQNQQQYGKSEQKDSNQKYQNQNQLQLQNQLAQYKHTDIELLKKCIALTAQNNRIKIQLQKQKQKNQFVCNQLKDYKIQLKQSRKIIENLQKKHHQRQADTIAKLQKNNSLFINNQNNFKKQKTEQVQSPKFANKTSQKTIIIQNTKQIQGKMEQMQKQYKQKIQQLTFRLKNSNKDNKGLQKIIQNQKQKLKVLWNFFNAEVPKMKEMVCGLTGKLDQKLQKVLSKNSQNYQ